MWRLRRGPTRAEVVSGWLGSRLGRGALGSRWSAWSGGSMRSLRLRRRRSAAASSDEEKAKERVWVRVRVWRWVVMVGMVVGRRRERRRRRVSDMMVVSFFDGWKWNKNPSCLVA